MKKATVQQFLLSLTLTVNGIHALPSINFIATYFSAEQKIKKTVSVFCTQPLLEKRKSLLARQSMNCVAQSVTNQERSLTKSLSDQNAAKFLKKPTSCFSKAKNFLPSKETISTTGKLITVDCGLIAARTIGYAPRMVLLGLGLYACGYSSKKSALYSAGITAGLTTAASYYYHRTAPF